MMLNKFKMILENGLFYVMVLIFQEYIMIKIVSYGFSNGFKIICLCNIGGVRIMLREFLIEQGVILKVGGIVVNLGV